MFQTQLALLVIRKRKRHVHGHGNNRDTCTTCRLRCPTHHPCVWWIRLFQQNISPSACERQGSLKKERDLAIPEVRPDKAVDLSAWSRRNAFSVYFRRPMEPKRSWSQGEKKPITCKWGTVASKSMGDRRNWRKKMMTAPASVSPPNPPGFQAAGPVERDLGNRLLGNKCVQGRRPVPTR